MSRFRCFIQPINAAGGWDDEIEITDDVLFDAMGSLKESVDNDEYNIGVFRFNDFGIQLRNNHGRYEKPGVSTTIFTRRRSDSIFRVKWQREDYLSLCGVAVAGQNKLSPIVDVYEGFIKDEASNLNMKKELISFRVVGFESILTQVETPFASLSNGDTFQQAIYKCLNQTAITNLLSVDTANWNLGSNESIDDVSSLENKTVKEALDSLLLISNSILFIKNRIVYITKRQESSEVSFKFFGPSSIKGLENTLDISNIRTGLSKTFNYWTWAGQQFKVVDQNSIDLNGIKKKEIDSALITNTVKQQSILSVLVSEFGIPKESFEITTPVSWATLQLFILDKITIDYPKVFIMNEETDELPVYGISLYGQAKYPTAVSQIFIADTRQFKILGRQIDTKMQTITLELKEI